MRNVIISTINHKDQRYDTVGDWYVDERDDLHIRVSRMHNPRCEELIAVHELCEALLCLARGIPQELVDKFDKDYETNRCAWDTTSEPGDAVAAPYRKEHFFATNVERLLCAEFGLNWRLYEYEVETL